MTTFEEPHVSPGGLAAESHHPEQPASLPQRCADWISYAVAVIQQAAPTAPEFISAEGWPK